MIVIGEQYWQRRFGRDPQLLGSTLTIDGEAHTVIGIAPAVYTEMWRVDAWVPLARGGRSDDARQQLPRRRRASEDGVTQTQARAGLEEMARELSRDYPTIATASSRCRCRRC